MSKTRILPGQCRLLVNQVFSKNKGLLTSPEQLVYAKLSDGLKSRCERSRQGGKEKEELRNWGDLGTSVFIQGRAAVGLSPRASVNTTTDLMRLG